MPAEKPNSEPKSAIDQKAVTALALQITNLCHESDQPVSVVYGALTGCIAGIAVGQMIQVPQASHGARAAFIKQLLQGIHNNIAKTYRLHIALTGDACSEPTRH